MDAPVIASIWWMDEPFGPTTNPAARRVTRSTTLPSPLSAVTISCLTFSVPMPWGLLPVAQSWKLALPLAPLTAACEDSTWRVTLLPLPPSAPEEGWVYSHEMFRSSGRRRVGLPPPAAGPRLPYLAGMDYQQSPPGASAAGPRRAGAGRELASSLLRELPDLGDGDGGRRPPGGGAAGGAGRE